MVEYATSRLLDEPLMAAIAQLNENAAEGQVAAARRVIGEELDVPRRNGPVERTGEGRRLAIGSKRLVCRNGGAGSPSVRRDGRPRLLASGLDEREVEWMLGCFALAVLLGGVAFTAIVAGLWWLSRQSGDVIGRLVALGFVVLGSLVIAYALAWMEQR